MISKIAIFTTKYKDFYFDAASPELIAEACLAILCFNKQNNLYLEPVTPMSLLTIQEQDLLSVGEGEFSSLNPNFKKELDKVIKPLRKQANVYQKTYDKNFKWMRKMEALLALPFDEASVIKVADEKNKKSTYLSTALIEERSDFPYENYEIIELDKPLDIWKN